MPNYSTSSQAHNDEQFELLKQFGVLNALYQATRDGCHKQYDERHTRFEEPFLNERAKGNDRWHYVDQELIHVANRFQMEIRTHAISRNPNQRMLFLQHGNLLISAHQVPTYGQAARYALHREPLMLIPPDRLEYTLDQIIAVTQQEFEAHGLEYWMFTYQQTPKRTPDWMMMGRPAQGQQDFYYQRDVMQALNIVHEHEATINLNPALELPKTRFDLPLRDRQEGEGEE